MHKAKEMRIRAGLSREEVAEKMGVSWQTVRYWELKKDSLRLDTAVELCKLYRCSLSQMAGTSEVDYSVLSLTDAEQAKVEAFVEGLKAARE